MTTAEQKDALHFGMPPGWDLQPIVEGGRSLTKVIRSIWSVIPRSWRGREALRAELELVVGKIVRDWRYRAPEIRSEAWTTVAQVLVQHIGETEVWSKDVVDIWSARRT